MILFFRTPTKSVIATEVSQELASEDIQKLSWLYGEATVENEENLKGCFIGPRREMITPWSTNAVEITQNMGLTGVLRIEEYFPVKDENAEYDPMLQRMYKGLNQEIFTVNIKPQPIVHIENLEEYNEKEGLALSREEMDYLLKVEKDLGRKLWRLPWGGLRNTDQRKTAAPMTSRSCGSCSMTPCRPPRCWMWTGRGERNWPPRGTCW